MHGVDLQCEGLALGKLRCTAQADQEDGLCQDCRGEEWRCVKLTLDGQLDATHAHFKLEPGYDDLWLIKEQLDPRGRLVGKVEGLHDRPHVGTYYDTDEPPYPPPRAEAVPHRRATGGE